MKLKSLLCLLAVCMVLIGRAEVKKKTTAKKAKPSFILLEAFTQKILPEKPHVTPTTGEHFIIVWNAPKFPETFFWRGDSGWLPCKMLNAHKVVCKSPDYPDGLEYSTSHVKGDDIHPGDTLELTPMLRGKFPVPNEIPKDKRNTLFFRTGRSGWLSYAVKEMGKKPDVTMP